MSPNTSNISLEALLLSLFTTKGSYLEAYLGMRKVKELKGENPKDCLYVRRAYSLFLEEELKDKVEIMKKIVEEYEKGI